MNKKHDAAVWLYKNISVLYNSMERKNLNSRSDERREVMTESTKKFVTEKLNEMINAFSCCAEAKKAAQDWLDGVGTEREAELTKALIAELEEDIMPIDTLIAFAESDAGAKVFGEEHAKEVAAHAKEIKEAGAVYCDCPACAAAEAILAKKDEL